MRRLPPLRTLQAFEAVARHNSVSRAADELAITPSAVSHRLRTLEDHLGVRLLHRTTRSVTLSDAGRDYLQSIASAFDRIERSSNRIADGRVSDILTVHCTPSFAPAWLVPNMAGFMATHPDIDLRIHASPEPVDFFRTDTDVEIRYGNADWTGLVVRPLIADRLAPLCAPELFEKIRHRPEAQRLDDVPLIVSERAPVDWPGWFRFREMPMVSSRGPRFDRGYLVLQAAAAGLGVGLESLVFAADYLDTGRLVPVFETDAEIVAGSHTLVYPPISAGIPKVMKFEAWITTKCRQPLSISPVETGG
jgi:LysR family glycine cleavage system transcriptional activator